MSSCLPSFAWLIVFTCSCLSLPTFDTWVSFSAHYVCLCVWSCLPVLFFSFLALLYFCLLSLSIKFGVFYTVLLFIKTVFRSTLSAIGSTFAFFKCRGLLVTQGDWNAAFSSHYITSVGRHTHVSGWTTSRPLLRAVNSLSLRCTHFACLHRTTISLCTHGWALSMRSVLMCRGICSSKCFSLRLSENN